MPYIQDIFAVPEKRADGILADKARDHTTAPDWGPFAAIPREMPPYQFDQHIPIDEPVGWTYFLSDPAIEHTPLQLPSSTYSLHKPAGWKASHSGLEECATQLTDEEKDAILAKNWHPVKENYRLCLRSTFDQFGWPDDDDHPELDKKISRLMAAHYNIEFRE